MNIYDQLQAVEDRYEELGELLSDPEVVSDTKRFMELSREEANTRETVTAYREYKQVIQSISDAEEMIKEALRPNFWRPVTDNDMGNDMNKTLRPWREAGRGAKLTSL